VILFAHGRSHTMGKPHPIELRERVVAFVNEGHSNREAARHFRVSPRFVNNMMILHRSSGSLAAAKQGHPPGGTKLMAHADWVRERMSAHGETTLDELCVALAERGIEIHRATVGRFLHRLGLSNKKKSQGKRAAQAGDRQGS
jgi:transposase